MSEWGRTDDWLTKAEPPPSEAVSDFSILVIYERKSLKFFATATVDSFFIFFFFIVPSFFFKKNNYFYQLTLPVSVSEAWVKSLQPDTRPLKVGWNMQSVVFCLFLLIHGGSYRLEVSTRGKGEGPRACAHDTFTDQWLIIIDEALSSCLNTHHFVPHTLTRWSTSSPFSSCSSCPTSGLVVFLFSHGFFVSLFFFRFLCLPLWF